ncbi:lytic polysaccharide monooxygenase [Parathielavia appendiculata]|uniref:lytic cellulose monooxygenase (C4-dehydrogenating) n=1 Tax=Parathielavia appendiculata TaxID=2587402 RepID=A0AAN6TWA3_9PEZI|nr:lytic polysaccharide monooxygenase [Parathielavia appendiculata]
MVLLLLAGLTVLTRWALAHGGLANYTVGETWYRGYDPSTPTSEQLGQPWMVQRQWASIDPIFSVTDRHIACNNPGTSPPSYIPLRAGNTITAVYWYWLHPVGPMSVWLARCETGDCRDEDVNEVAWFKIWEAGLLEGPNLAEGTWYQKWFQRWDGSPALWPVRIPAGLKGGPYMIRHEILSIHVERKPQFYPECAHLNVTGGGELEPPREYLVKFPGAYAEDDPSIFIDIYSEENANKTDYAVPGGPIWDGFGVVDKFCVGC